MTRLTRIAGITGLCLAGWLTIAAWTIDRASQALYELGDTDE